MGNYGLRECACALSTGEFMACLTSVYTHPHKTALMEFTCPMGPFRLDFGQRRRVVHFRVDPRPETADESGSESFCCKGRGIHERCLANHHFRHQAARHRTKGQPVVSMTEREPEVRVARRLPDDR